uniref:Uncharacterized protein n=1 Tax=Amphora coffeiformis TaxID=265554 RepID=A0A7S3L6H0_9STRA
MEKQSDFNELQEKLRKEKDKLTNQLRPALAKSVESVEADEMAVKSLQERYDAAKLAYDRKVLYKNSVRSDVDRSESIVRLLPAEVEAALQTSNNAVTVYGDTMELLAKDPRQRPLAAKENPSAEVLAKVAGLVSSDMLFDLPLESSKKKKIVGLMDRARRLANLGVDLRVPLTSKATKKGLQKELAVKCFPNDLPHEVQKLLKNTSPRSERRAKVAMLFASGEDKDEDPEEVTEAEAVRGMKRAFEIFSGTDIMELLSDEQMDVVAAESARKRRRRAPEVAAAGSATATAAGSDTATASDTAAAAGSDTATASDTAAAMDDGELPPVGTPLSRAG